MPGLREVQYYLAGLWLLIRMDPRGFRFLEVDASSDSRPILERLGFSAVTTTTPYVWSPPA